ncbi:MAG: hypothetical protein BROFUL_03203 [Candidatus Brocadia fulgida]|uniref:Class I SAM-dependent methyltransferase n=1 Tax=Candidatus Brocadia fulgida TaxID=380242 RepID=A0A0M2USZ8_9BACT|nr:MAG: hypothetical protein BROFUL_03203 [Candidatus Brocadia fulgida]
MIESKKLRKEYSQNFNILELIKYFFPWWISQNGEKSALSDKRPWIVFTAIKYLDAILTKDMMVFEYGSGGSTLFFAERVKTVISVEHDKSWWKVVSDKVNVLGHGNSHLWLIEPTISDKSQYENIADIDSYKSEDKNYRGQSFEKYVKKIDEYPDEYFDLVMVDGRARPSCFKHAVSKVRLGGYFVLDNAEREYYFNIHENLNNTNWEKIDFYGPGPYCSYFWRTSIWLKVGN